LKRLVDGRTVEPAWDATAAQQRHQQDRLGVALPESVGNNT
jgi:hypothetical protein